MTMLSARLYTVISHALHALDTAVPASLEPYVAFEGTLTTATVDGELLEFEVEYDDGKHFASLLG